MSDAFAGSIQPMPDPYERAAALREARMNHANRVEAARDAVVSAAIEWANARRFGAKQPLDDPLIAVVDSLLALGEDA